MHSPKRVPALNIFTHCLKITQNVAFEFFNFDIFFTNFCPIKIDLSGNTV